MRLGLILRLFCPLAARVENLFICPNALRPPITPSLPLSFSTASMACRLPQQSNFKVLTIIFFHAPLKCLRYCIWQCISFSQYPDAVHTLASWVCSLGSCTSSCDYRGPRLDLMLCHHHLQSLNNFIFALCYVSEVRWDNGACVWTVRQAQYVCPPFFAIPVAQSLYHVQWIQNSPRVCGSSGRCKARRR